MTSERVYGIICMQLDDANYTGGSAALIFDNRLAESNQRGDVMSVEEMRRFERMLAFHAAATLMGVKCGSLLTPSVKEHDLAGGAAMIEQKHYGSEIGVRTVSRCAERTLLYVYHRSLLSEALEADGVRDFLSEYGYSGDFSVDRCLDRLCERLADNEFPHEVGLFLGYPLEDVKGFIYNCGQRCKLCGVWKVYGDVEQAKRFFDRCEECRKRLCGELASGKELCACVA